MDDILDFEGCPHGRHPNDICMLCEDGITICKHGVQSDDHCIHCEIDTSFHRNVCHWVSEGRIVLHHGQLALKARKLVGRRATDGFYPLGPRTKDALSDLVEVGLVTYPTADAPAQVVS